MPKPTIAAVNGGANGLGADMAMACDFVIAAESANSFTWSYIHLRLIPDGGGMYFLPRRTGLPFTAKALIFLGAARWRLPRRCNWRASPIGSPPRDQLVGDDAGLEPPNSRVRRRAGAGQKHPQPRPSG